MNIVWSQQAIDDLNSIRIISPQRILPLRVGSGFKS